MSKKISHHVKMEWRGGYGRSATWRAVCACGQSSGSGTQSAARKWAERHARIAKHLSDRNGNILGIGDLIQPKMTAFDGPKYLFGHTLRIERLGNTRVSVSIAGRSGKTWRIDPRTTELVQKGC